MGNVDQRLGLKAKVAISFPVPTQGQFVGRAAADVSIDRGRHQAARVPLKIVQAEQLVKIGLPGRRPRRGTWLGIARASEPIGGESAGSKRGQEIFASHTKPLNKKSFHSTPKACDRWPKRRRTQLPDGFDCV